ncbi:MAG: PDZ domain-containing protein [Pseudomonadota bacterium]
MRILGVGLGLALLAVLLMTAGGQGGQISPDSAWQASLRAPDVTFSAPGTNRAPRLGTEMNLGEQAVEEIVQRALLNVERQLLENEHRAVLGIVAGEPTVTGVRVTGVTPDGPAQQGGLRSGDVILAIDGTALEDDGVSNPVEQLVAVLQGAAPGDSVSLHYKRADAITYADVVLGDLADLPGTARQHSTDRWYALELTAMTVELGRYFGTDEGLLITRAPDHTPQLQDGDVLLRIDGRTPRTAEHARAILTSYRLGEALALSVVRDGSQIEVAIGEVASAPVAVPTESFPTPPLVALEALDACVMRRL